MPIYGVEKYIERCARSLFNQTMKDGIEFIFVNDASPDNSILLLNTIVNEFPARKNQIKIITHPINKGLAAARNTGYANSSGQYIICCDSDDWVEPEMYELLFNKAIETNADLVACDYWGDYPNRQIKYNQTPDCDTNEYRQQIISGKVHNSLWNKLICKKAYEQLDFRFSEGINLWEDVSVLCRLIHYINKIAMIKKPLYHYSQTMSNSYTKLISPISVANIESAAKIVCDFYRNLSAEKYLQEIKWIRSRAYVGCINRLPSWDIIDFNTKYTDIHSSDIQSLPMPFYSKISSILILHGYVSIGLALNTVANKLRRLIR